MNRQVPLITTGLPAGLNDSGKMGEILIGLAKLTEADCARAAIGVSSSATMIAAATEIRGLRTTASLRGACQAAS